MTVTQEQRIEYKRQRGAQPYLSAAFILGCIKREAESESIPEWIPGSPWEHKREHDGLVFKFKAEPDEYVGLEDVGLGRFISDREANCPTDLADGYIDHHKHGGAKDEHRWWHSEMTAEEHATWYHERGMAKGPAHNLGVSLLLKEYRAASTVASGGQHIYSLGVSVHDASGRELASEWLGGVFTDGPYEQDREYYRETFWELAQEAETQARSELSDEAAETRKGARRERAWALVEQAAEGDDIQTEAAILYAEETADAVREGVSG